MKNSIFYFLTFFAAVAAAQPEKRSVSIDKDFSPFMGAEDLLFAESLMARGYDALIPPPDHPKKKLFPAVGRFLECVVIWNPIQYFMNVVQHEYFGHGYRLRSLGSEKATVIGYIFDSPPPFGGGGGATEFEITEAFTLADGIAVTIAGLEAQDILAQRIYFDMIESHAVPYRVATAYSLARQSLLTYVAAVFDTEEVEGSDIDDYVNEMNLAYPDALMTKRGVMVKSLLNLLDPLTFYSYVSPWKYIISGETTSLRMIPIREGTKMLPNWKVTLTPYGIEHYLETYWSVDATPAYAYIRGGQHADHGYGGCGIVWDSLCRIGRGRLGFAAHAWLQPMFREPRSYEAAIEGVPPTEGQLATTRVFGASGTLTVKYGSERCSLQVEAGYKTKGYLPGYDLGASPIIRGGLAFRF